MTFSVKTMIMASLFILTPVFSYAAPLVYPVIEVFGFDITPEQKTSPSTKPNKQCNTEVLDNSKMKPLQERAPTFAKWIAEIRSKDRVGKDTIAEEFNSVFRNEFGALAAKRENLTDVTKHEVLVASLHLIRASEYVVPKMGNSEVHMPITLSIIITNPSTAEVIYSFTKTSYATARLTTSKPDGQEAKILLDQTASNYRSLLTTLVQEAKAGYNPQKIEITVAKEWKGLYILDKGGKFGIAKDDSLMDATGNEITVKYVTEDYAVAQSLLGKVERGQKFFKFVTSSTASQFAKPRVLTMHEGWKNDDLANISRLFESQLSKESAFTVLPLNVYFRKLLLAVADFTNAGREITNQRELPDYFIKFTATQPRYYTVSEKGKFSINHYEQYILGELLDKQGRIIFSAIGTNKIEDKNVGDMVFDKISRLEVLQKNAVLDLAEQFAKSIKFSHFVMPVKKVSGNSIELEDSSRELRPGQSVVVYRNIGRVDGIKTDVTVPLWQASVVETEKGQVKLDLVLPIVEKGVNASKGDVVILDAVSAGTTADQSETSLTYCSKISSKLGSIDMDDFSVISRTFGHLLPYTMYDNDEQFPCLIHAAVQDDGRNFKDSDSIKISKIKTGGRCLLPVYKTDISEKQCPSGECTAKVAIAAGYRLYVNNERKGGAATEDKITIEEAIESSLDNTIQSVLSKSTLSLLKRSVTKVRFQ